MTPEDELLGLIDNWIDGLIISISESAKDAYAAGALHALSQLRTGVSLDVVQRESIEFAAAYKKRLVEEGLLSVTDLIKDDAGNVTGFRTRDIKWLSGDKRANMRNELMDAIRNGILEGKPTGVRVSSKGTYPKGSIAEDIQKITDSYKSQASTIARTETSRCYYNGEIERYARLGVQYVEYLGAPDACDDCQEFIGRVFVLGSEPHHPMHPNCRCDYRPYFPAVGEIVNCGDGKTYMHTMMEDGTEKPVFICMTEHKSG